MKSRLVSVLLVLGLISGFSGTPWAEERAAARSTSQAAAENPFSTPDNVPGFMIMTKSGVDFCPVPAGAAVQFVPGGWRTTLCNQTCPEGQACICWPSKCKDGTLFCPVCDCFGVATDVR